MENNFENNLIAEKIPIDVYYLSRDSKETIDKPYFFIKWAPEDKRYRVSASFKYLNKKYGLRINIIRNLQNLNISKESLEKLIKKILEEPNNNIDASLIYRNFLDKENSTEIFLIERNWNNDTNYVVVFFSLKYWRLEDYLQEVNL